MKHAKWVAAGGVAVVATLLWPGPPAGAAPTSLGGWQVAASASVVHIELFEPTIPLPASPQGDFSLGYSSATTESGTARATASYLWPGSVIGDGFDELTNEPGTSYPVQVNSKFPATAAAPKKNTAQLTKGNGMTTSTNGYRTNATVTGLGIDSNDTNPTTGLGQGLGQLGGGSLPIPGASSLPSLPAAPSSAPVSTPALPKSPVPVPAPLADLVTVKGMTSTSQAIVGQNTVTSRAGAAAGEIDLLGGIISMRGIQVASTIVSNGKASSSAGKVTIGSMSIAGKQISFGHNGFQVTDKKAALPAFPAQATAALKSLGISLRTTPLTEKAHRGHGHFAGQGLIVTINTIPLRSKLDSPLNMIVQALGKDAAEQLAPLLQLRPKIVVKIGEAINDASAFPAYKVPPIKAAPPAPTTGGGALPATTGGAGGNTGGLGGLGGTGTTGGATTATTGGTTGGGITSGGAANTTATPAPQATGLDLPGLAEVPRLLILGALAFAGVLGWALQTMGGTLLGGASSCQYGLRKGVPDLRKN